MLVLIRSENRKKPLSDQAIVNVLGQQGISLSRRVITKYRQAMDIPSAFEPKAQIKSEHISQQRKTYGFFLNRF